MEKNFLSIRVRCETGVFGVDPSTLDQVEDNGKLLAFILNPITAECDYNNILHHMIINRYFIASSNS